MTYTVSVYKSGNSKVMTIPAKVPIEIGDVLEFQDFSPKDTLFKIKKKKTPSRKKHNQHLVEIKKIAGGAPGSSMGMKPVKLKHYLDHMYDDHLS
jgi:antitoxin component of MazEF toxin-antitoxin module